jgi:hypothetical protein
VDVNCVSSARRAVFSRIDDPIADQADLLEHSYLRRLTTAARDCSLVTVLLIRSAPDPRHCLALGCPRTKDADIPDSRLAAPANSSTLHDHGWPVHEKGRQQSFDLAAKGKAHAVFILPRRHRHHSLRLPKQSELNSASGSIALHAGTNTDRRPCRLANRPGQRCSARGSIWHFDTRTRTLLFVTSVERLYGTITA